MTCEVIDTAHPSGLSWGLTDPRRSAMTTLVSPVPTTGATDRARTVLRADAVVTAAVALVALLSPLDWYGETPGWLVRGTGGVLLVVAADLLLAARLSGRRLLVAATVTAELAFGWVAATAAVLALVDLPTAGREVLLLQGLLTLGFGVAHLRAARALR
jgi:hypothetical protein